MNHIALSGFVWHRGVVTERRPLLEATVVGAAVSGAAHAAPALAYVPSDVGTVAVWVLGGMIIGTLVGAMIGAYVSLAERLRLSPNLTVATVVGVAMLFAIVAAPQQAVAYAFVFGNEAASGSHALAIWYAIAASLSGAGVFLRRYQRRSIQS